MTESPKPRKRPGPQPGAKTGTRTVTGKVIGRDKVVVPGEDVEKLAQLGATDREIADFFGVKDDTLRRHFADILLKGRTDLRVRLRRAMIDNAINQNNTTMQIWLSKNILQMSDNPRDTDVTLPLPWNGDQDA